MYTDICEDCGYTWDHPRALKRTQDGKVRCKKCAHLFRSRKYLASAKGQSYQKQYAVEHREEKIAQATKWAADNPERRKEIVKKWRQSEKGKANSRARNKRRYWVDVKNTKVMKEVFDEQTECQTCGSTENLTLDHIIPLTKGGRGTKDNIQVLCNTCNMTKGNRVDVRTTA